MHSGARWGFLNRPGKFQEVSGCGDRTKGSGAKKSED